ncbi:MAG: hypothetical protein ACKOZT_01045 [Cyanobium sp.]
MVNLHIANTVCDLIQGDVQEHLPLERIPLTGDVLGLGTTSGWDNGELTFLCDDPELAGALCREEGSPVLAGSATDEAGSSATAALAGSAGNTAGSITATAALSSSEPASRKPVRSSVFKSEPHNGGLRLLEPGSGLQHFPYVCFSDDATSLRRPVPPALLANVAGRPLQAVVAEAIAAMTAAGQLEAAPIYGLRLLSRWSGLVITVASKLCLGQQRRNQGLADLQPIGAAAQGVGASIYDRLPHFRLSAIDPGDPADPIRWLSDSLQWEGCGFFDTEPALGRVTVPVAGASLHLHGCSTDLRHGGHLHHEHPSTALAAIDWLVLYPLQRLRTLGSDLAVRDLSWHEGTARFTVLNAGNLDASDVGVAVVLNDCYSGHRYLRLPWLAAGEAELVTMPLALGPGRQRLEVIVDPERQILEEEAQRGNNRLVLEIEG